MKNLLKKTIAPVLPVLLLCLALTGCGSSQQSVNMYDLQMAMLLADDTLPEMITINNSAEDAGELFGYLSNIDYDKVDSFFLAYSSEGLADEIAVIRLKDQKDAKEAYDSLVAHKEKRVNLYKTYDPTQTDRAEKALIQMENNYVTLIICDKSSEVLKVFKDGIL